MLEQIIHHTIRTHIMSPVEPTYRINDKLKLAWEFRYSGKNNDIGYVERTEAEDSIYFGMRNVKTVENTIEASYIFTSRSYLSFRLRHYWSKADYLDNYYLLEDDGYLDPVYNYAGVDDINFNTFNIDMSYVWRFAPGSELSFVWKNSIYSLSDQLPADFIENLNLTFASPQVNSFSLKILYYLDYQYLRRKSKKDLKYFQLFIFSNDPENSNSLSISSNCCSDYDSGFAHCYTGKCSIRFFHLLVLWDS